MRDDDGVLAKSQDEDENIINCDGNKKVRVFKVFIS